MATGSFGRYQLLDVLGRGPTGEVFRAHDTVTNHVVAVKLLPADLSGDPEFAQRFRQEAQIAAHLNDPHVVPINDYGEVDGRLYVGMPFIEGRDLGSLIADNGGRLAPAQAVSIIDQVAAALDAGHRAGLVHGDVAPSNILVTGGGFACLTGFGVPARTGQTRDPRADIYALAWVLHESLTGQRPHPGAGLHAPPYFDAVIARGVAADPDQRYRTATEFAAAARAALERFASPSLPVRVARVLVAVLTVVVAVGLVALLVTGHRRAEPGIDQLGGTRVTLTASTLNGSPPTGDVLSTAQKIISARVGGLKIPGSQVAVAAGTVVVTVPGNHADQIRTLGQTGRLYIRPVISSTPARPGRTGRPPPASGNLGGRIAKEKQLRQSTNRGVQFLALQFQATRCGLNDVLAGNDDPRLPLVTCSTDHKAAYLLAPSILGNDQIQKASSSSEQRAGSVVDLQFTGAGAKTWAEFTGSHVGTQAAFTLDSAVVSAPRITEAIPDGRTQISAGFTLAQARDLANMLNYQPLPVPFTTSTPQTIAPKPGAAPARSTWPPTGLVAAGIGLLVVLVGALLFLYRHAIGRRQTGGLVGSG